MIARIRDGLENMHDDQKRRAFLLEMGARLDELAAWVGRSDFATRVQASYVPTFMHGGTSQDKWVLMGINPGADDQGEEHEFKRNSPQNFLAFHERFFEWFPALRRNAKQAWWCKAYRVSRVLKGEVVRSAPVPWKTLQQCSDFVVQDLLPFHGRRSATLPARAFERGNLRELAEATITGLTRSQAKGVLVCNRRGYEIFRAHLGEPKPFALDGRTRSGKQVRIDGYVGRLGTVPLVALDNEFISQPKFPYEEALPLFRDVLRAQGIL